MNKTRNPNPVPGATRAVRFLINLTATLGAALPGLLFAANLTVDFSFRPPEWQTAICLPDDPHKTLVDRQGRLLYHYGICDSVEFGTRVSLQIDDRAIWKSQDLHSPRVPVVRTRREAEGLEIVEQAFAVVTGPTPAEAGSARPVPAREDIVIIRVTNTGTTSRMIHPALVIDTPFRTRLEGEAVRVHGGAPVRCSIAMRGGPEDGKVPLKAAVIAPGESLTLCLSHDGGGPITVKRALEERERAIAFWENGAGLPYDRIRVPDPGIQALLDSSIRNMWQAREVKDGLPVFQVGPTCYRGLWIADGAFLLEAATLLGAGDQARRAITHELAFQQEDGGIKVMHTPLSKENGIVLWTCLRHARLTRDKAWLESLWPRLERIAAHIARLREETWHNSHPLDDGLLPGGFADGGLGTLEEGEYSNVYWNLAGIRAFAEAARWLGKDELAAKWQAEFDDFMAAFRKAATRDMRSDPHGNRYLPIPMGEEGAKQLPQRAQWAFCHAVHPGRIFPKDDPLVAGNLAMLAATEREGMVHGTGWDPDGIWTYFASFHAHAWLWQGNGHKAADILYAFANHAAPLLVWREEQSLRGNRFKKVGDMPHNWASAEFIRLVVHLLQIDRGDELHLLEGLPAKWTRPGMTTTLQDIATPFGPLDMKLKVDDDGESARLTVNPLAEPACRRVVVHTSGWAGGNESGTISLDPGEAHEIHIRIDR